MLTKPLKTPHSPDQVACPVSFWLGGIKDDDKKPAVHSAILSGGGGGDEEKTCKIALKCFCKVLLGNEDQMKYFRFYKLAKKGANTANILLNIFLYFSLDFQLHKKSCKIFP